MNKTDLLYLHHGKIYKIVCNITGECYYGSTIQRLEHRLHVHEGIYRQYLKNNANYYSVFEILERGNYDIHLVENYGCLCRKQLEAMEGLYIKHYPCINRNVAGGDIDKKLRKYNRDDYLRNKPYKQNYYRNNKIRMISYQKERYIKNKRNSYYNRKDDTSNNNGISIFDMLNINEI
jgi:hypothetical protein